MVTDWLMVVITAIYVVATIAIWFANNKSARMTEKTARRIQIAVRRSETFGVYAFPAT